MDTPPHNFFLVKGFANAPQLSLDRQKMIPTGRQESDPRQESPMKLGKKT
jgi:hypothetical protein